MNEQLLTQGIGPNGIYGSVTVALVEGKLVSTVQLSPAAVLNLAAQKIGGTVPAELAAFLEKAVGLS